VARLGGHEFGILLDGVLRADCVSVAERTVASLYSPSTIEGRVIHVGASISLAYATEHAWIRGRSKPRKDVWLAVLLILVAAWTTLQTREVFGHYLLLLFVPLTFLNAALLRPHVESAIATAQSMASARFALTFVMFAFLVPSALLLARPQRAFDAAERQKTPASAMETVAVAIDSLTVPGERVAIWGWASPLWITSRTLPGTRDIHTARQLMPSVMQPYFVERFANDLIERKPAWFIDVAAWVRQFSDITRYGHHNYERVANVVEQNYELVAELDRARIYRRRAEAVAAILPVGRPQ
jgi:hypothetical protein